MARELSQTELLRELEPVAEENVNRHFAMAKEWHPHDYVPWDEGRNFAAMGGVDWDPAQSQLSEVAKAAMITNLLTEDNLPSYHREIAENFSHGRRLGHLGRPLDRRGEPPRHRHARLPGRHPRRRPGRARAGPHGPHDQRLRATPEPRATAGSCTRSRT